MRGHIAVTCTYNDGGEGPYVGFADICTPQTITYNIKNGTVWCGQVGSPCRRYYESGFARRCRPKNTCTESVLFKDWCVGAGSLRSGVNAGQPIHWSGVLPGKIALLTTRFPGNPEIERKIIGLYKISKVTDSPHHETVAYSDPAYRVRLTLDEAKSTYFWNRETTAKHPEWGAGMVRYLDDEYMLWVLKSLGKTVQDPQNTRIIQALLSDLA